MRLNLNGEISKAIIVDLLGMPEPAVLLTKAQKGQPLRTWHKDTFFEAKQTYVGRCW